MYTQIEDYTIRYLIVYRLQPSMPSPKRMLRVSATRGMQRTEIGPFPAEKHRFPFVGSRGCGRQNEGNSRSHTKLSTRCGLQKSPPGRKRSSGLQKKTKLVLCVSTYQATTPHRQQQTAECIGTHVSGVSRAHAIPN